MLGIYCEHSSCGNEYGFRVSHYREAVFVVPEMFVSLVSAL